MSRMIKSRQSVQAMQTGLFAMLLPLFFLMLLSANLCAQSSIIANPDFESSTNEWFGYGPTPEIAGIEQGETGFGARVSNRTLFWNGIAQNIQGRLVPGRDYRVEVQVRSANGNQPLQLTINQNDDRGETLIKLGDVEAVDSEWRLLEGGFRYQENGQINHLFFAINGLGDAPSTGDFLIDSVVFIENDWRDAADQRIESFRKRDVELRFVDSAGAAVSVSDLNVRQTANRFAFGAALNDTVSVDPLYADFFRSNFDWATVEWFAQWKPVELNRGTEDYTNADFAAGFAEENGINLRGHSLFWPAEQFRPQWLESLPDAELETEINERLDSVVPRFQNRFIHWDVGNEMVHHTFFRDRLGDGIRSLMFQRAAELDPKARLFLNETGLLESAITRSQYKQLVGFLDGQQAGDAVDAIGMQSHFFQGNSSPRKLELAIDAMASLGKEIWLTEFSMVNPDPDERADGLEDFFRYAFSRPEIHGLTIWGFHADTHWLGADASLINSDWTANAAGIRYQDLRDQWTTEISVDAGIDVQQFSFRGFHGSYRISGVDAAGNPFTHLVHVEPGSGAQEIVIDTDAGTTGTVVCGTAGDDLFEYDRNRPHVYQLNGIRYLIPALADIDNVEFCGGAGVDRLQIQMGSERNRFLVRESGMSDRDSTDSVTWPLMENVDLTAGTIRDQAIVFDTPGDDTFESSPFETTMVASDFELTLNQFFHIIGRTQNGGIDSLQMNDSEFIDFGFSDLRVTRLRDGTPLKAVRRFENLELVTVVSLANRDVMEIVAPEGPNVTSFGDGDFNLDSPLSSLAVQGMRFYRVDFGEDNPDQVVLHDSPGDDRLTIDPLFLNLFSTDYSYQTTGITRALMEGSGIGNDIAVLRDGAGNDSLIADGETVTLTGVGLESPGSSFVIENFAVVRAVAGNGGQNTVTVNGPPTFLLDLRGGWQPTGD